MSPATTWAIAAHGSDERDRAAPGDAVPATAEGTAAAVSTAAAVPAGPTLTEAVYTGRTSDDGLAVAVGIKDGRAAGYVCDGKTVEAWLEGTVTSDRLTLHGRDAGTTLTATADQRSLLGEVSVGGEVRPFSARIATGKAGLFSSRRSVEGITTRIGWIVLPDGSVVGVRNSGGARSTAPPLDPTTLRASEDGSPIPVDRLSGASVVLGG